MFKNKQICIFISLICASTLSLYSMEQAPGITVHELQNYLNIQQTRLHKYRDTVEIQMQSMATNSIQGQIDRTQKRLNQNPPSSSHEFYQIRDVIGFIELNLDNITRIRAQMHSYVPNHLLDHNFTNSNRSSNQSEISAKNSKINCLEKIISYLSGATICAGIGLYSYYKLPEQLQWCRPALIGLSVFGGTTCSILAYKNLKTLISKKTY